MQGGPASVARGGSEGFATTRCAVRWLKQCSILRLNVAMLYAILRTAFRTSGTAREVEVETVQHADTPEQASVRLHGTGRRARRPHVNHSLCSRTSGRLSRGRFRFPPPQRRRPEALPFQSAARESRILRANLRPEAGSSCMDKNMPAPQLRRKANAKLPPTAGRLCPKARPTIRQRAEAASDKKPCL